MEVLIVARTRMSGMACCLGGLDLSSGRSLRLMQSNGQNMPQDIPFEVGEIWDLEYTLRPDREPPHVEDVLVRHFDYLRPLPNLKAFLLGRVPAWRGGPDQVFDGRLLTTGSGSGYICQRGGLPQCSTGYWLPDADLEREVDNGRVRYRYSNGGYPLRLAYVGFAPSVPCLPRGTLLRVSLARWWRPADAYDREERCYLQLSGWYLD